MTYYQLEVKCRDINTTIASINRSDFAELLRAGYREMRERQLDIEEEARRHCRYTVRSQHALMHLRNGIRHALLAKYGHRPHTKVAGEAYEAGFEAGARWRIQNEG